jgi:hypothetical protein
MSTLRRIADLSRSSAIVPTALSDRGDCSRTHSWCLTSWAPAKLGACQGVKRLGWRRLLPKRERLRVAVSAQLAVLRDEPEPMLDRGRVDQPVGGISGEG